MPRDCCELLPSAHSSSSCVEPSWRRSNAQNGQGRCEHKQTEVARNASYGAELVRRITMSLDWRSRKKNEVSSTWGGMSTGTERDLA